MGVYSELSREALAAAVVGWGRGNLVDAAPTPQGIENSNYFVVTEDGSGERHDWVLTVMTEAPTPIVLSLLERLAAADLPVPAPVADLDGRQIGNVDDHPALLTPRFPGTHPEDPSAAQCRALGEFLGRMHHITVGLHGPEHPRDLSWLESAFGRHHRRMGFGASGTLRTAIDAIASASAQHAWQRMPRGLVHGDLFRDNVLMDGDQIRGVIDFHHSAHAPLTFDLAVAAVDWCSDTQGRLDRARCQALLEGYVALRPLTREERWFWPLMLVLAAVRFLVARLESPRKPPAEMAARLADRLDRPMYLSPVRTR